MKLNIIKRKTKKLIRDPGAFFRDFLIKRYPIYNTEMAIDEMSEIVLSRYADINCLVSQEIDIPVDVVFTWVDDSDAIWQKKYQRYQRSDGSKASKYATDIARFENHNELLYSVKSVKKFMPWVRRIFIVTDKQIPDFLDLSDNIEIVYHSQIINKKYLPTFNSHVIEAHLHNISGLSENFIYFNDDVFVARPLAKEHFFSANGLASLFISAKTIDKLIKRGVDTPTMNACILGEKLLADEYSLRCQPLLTHTYFPLKKSAYKIAYAKYSEYIEDFLDNKFRGDNDLNLATYFVPWIMYCEGLATEKIDICYYFNIRSNQAANQYQKLLYNQRIGTEPHSFCANDFTSNVKVPVLKYRENLLSMLETYYK